MCFCTSRIRNGEVYKTLCGKFSLSSFISIIKKAQSLNLIFIYISLSVSLARGSHAFISWNSHDVRNARTSSAEPSPDGYIVVLERLAEPWVMPHTFFSKNSGWLSENIIRHLFHQLVQVISHCVQRMVKHHFINPEHIMINAETLEQHLETHRLSNGEYKTLTTGQYEI